jgi:hypothetical protein
MIIRAIRVFGGTLNIAAGDLLYGAAQPYIFWAHRTLCPSILKPIPILIPVCLQARSIHHHFKTYVRPGYCVKFLPPIWG